MRVGVLGTGTVGHALATKLAGLGHDVTMASREAGNEKAVAWVEATGGNADEGSFADAAGSAELVVNATAGTASLAALEQAGADNLSGKVLLDVATRSTSPPACRRRSRCATRTVLESRSSGRFRRRRSSRP